MNTKQTPTILVLGSTGMLGRVVYKNLKKRNPQCVLGTTRKESKRFLYLNVNQQESISTLLEDIKPEYVINCIGILKDGNTRDMYLVNVLFPKILKTLSKKLRYKIINISSDAVYGSTSGIVDEYSKTNPLDNYAKSKLKGETKINTLNIRTSLIGFDPKEHKGLLEYALKDTENVTGFTNQIWSGGTTLQVAKFIEDIIFTKLNSLFQSTSIVNFAPLGPVSKHELLETFANIISKNKIKKGKSTTHTTVLKSNYLDERTLSKYNRGLATSLNELIIFDRTYAKTFKKN